MLTRKQHQLLCFIESYLADTGCSPSFDEMKDGLGLHSKSGIHRLISALEERGFLRRHKQRARAIEILRMPPAANADRPAPGEPPASRLLKTGATPFNAPGDLTEETATESTVAIPLYGRIAAGVPIEAIGDTGEVTHVAPSLLGRGSHYALKVSGDSMEGAGIFNADTVIIRASNVAENGDIVVALIDREEVTLKRLYRRGAQVALESANPRFETRVLPSSRVQIQGILTSLYRRY